MTSSLSPCCPPPCLPPCLPPLKADLLLLHAPAFFDFRDRRDVYFPFLGTSGDVPITPLYEYFPVGFKTIQRFLSGRGYSVKILNLSSLLLRYRGLDFRALVEALDVKLVGIDLHWMVHVQGSLSVAENIRRLRPDIPLILGGISSSYYARQLIEYPQVDMVMRGYDTLEPMAALMAAMTSAGDVGRDLQAIPNLLWKSRDGQVHDNGISHAPGSFGCGIDWSSVPQDASGSMFSILELLSTQNAGCGHGCGWCGGSREAFGRLYGGDRAMAFKPIGEVAYELETMSRVPNVDRYHLYSVGSYNEGRERMKSFIDGVAKTGLKSVNYEQFHLTSDDMLRHMVKANKRTSITLSPESHDLRVARLAGRGAYTNEELEAWLARAFEHGIHKVDIWYFVGMPEQDESSVMHTVDYCERLLEKFKGRAVNPMICPMIPFLDPASTFFEHPGEHGYRVFHRTVEEHRVASERASLINRINYETRWLSRAELVRVGFRAVRSLMDAKARIGMFPRPWVQEFNWRIDDALSFLSTVHEVDCLADEGTRSRELEKLGDEILRRNEAILYSGVMNQAFPVNRQIGGRWFDELGWEPEELAAVHGD